MSDSSCGEMEGERTDSASDFVSLENLPAEAVLPGSLAAEDGTERFQQGSRLLLLTDQTVEVAIFQIGDEIFSEPLGKSTFKLGLHEDCACSHRADQSECQGNTGSAPAFKSLTRVAELISKGELTLPVEVCVRCRFVKDEDGKLGRSDFSRELSRRNVKVAAVTCRARLLSIGEVRVLLALADNHKLCTISVSSHPLRFRLSGGKFAGEELLRKAVLLLASAVNIRHVEGFGSARRLSAAMKSTAEACERSSDTDESCHSPSLKTIPDCAVSVTELRSTRQGFHVQRPRKEQGQCAMPSISETTGRDEGYSSAPWTPRRISLDDPLQDSSTCIDAVDTKVSTSAPYDSPHNAGNEGQPITPSSPHNAGNEGQLSSPTSQLMCEIDELSPDAFFPPPSLSDILPNTAQSISARPIPQQNSDGADKASPNLRQAVLVYVADQSLGRRRSTGDSTMLHNDRPKVLGARESGRQRYGRYSVCDGETFAPLMPDQAQKNSKQSALSFWRERCELLERQLYSVEKTLQESAKARRDLQEQVDMAKKVHNRGTALNVIKRMSCSEVQMLLKDFGLGQYCERFSEHHVNGQKLVAFNEHLLESSLLIKNGFHRLKIMQAARGNIRLMTILH